MNVNIFDSANKLLNESINNLENIQFQKPDNGTNIITDDNIEDELCKEIVFNVEMQTKEARTKINNRLRTNAKKYELSISLAQFDKALPMKKQVTCFLDICSIFVANMQNHFNYISNINTRNKTIQNMLNMLTNNDKNKIKKSDLINQFDKNNIILAQYINKWTVYMKSYISICNKLFDLFNLSKLNSEEISVFSLRYFELYDYVTISERTYMCERRVYLLRTSGIKKMAKYLTDNHYSTILDYFNIDFLTEICNVE